MTGFTARPASPCAAPAFLLSAPGGRTDRVLRRAGFALALALLAFPGEAPAANLTRERVIETRAEELEIRQGPAGEVIGLAGGVTWGEEGEPGLPARSVFFEIPEGYRVAWTRGEVLASEEIPGWHDVAPVPSGVSHASPAGRLERNPALYAASRAIPEHPVEKGVEGYMRGHHLAAVIARPVSYRPDEGRLRLATRLRVTIGLEPDPSPVDVARDLRPNSRAGRHFDSIVGELTGRSGPADRRDRFEPALQGGVPFSPRFRPSVDGSEVPYVIVTNDLMAPQYQRLADWKTESGVPAVVRTVEWIQANYPKRGDLAETIRIFLRDCMEKWGTEWVLLGGDTDVIPVRIGVTNYFGGENIPTDMYYGSLQGTWNADGDNLFGEGYFSSAEPGDGVNLFPDVFVGRAPSNTLAEATALVDKFLVYEKTPPLGNFANTILELGEVLFPQDWTPGDTIIFDGADVCEDLNPYIWPTWQQTKMYENYVPFGALPEIKSAVIESVNVGFGVIHHVGHGFRNTMAVGLGGLTIDNPDADAFVNGGEAGLLYSINCTSAAIDFDCLGERWVLNPSGGAVANIGSTRFDFPSTGRGYQNEFYRIVFAERNSEIGYASAMSKVAFIPFALTDNAHRWTQFTQLLLGDPQCALWLTRPYAMNVVAPANFTLGAGPMHVTVDSAGVPVDSALVTLYKEGDAYASGYTNPSGAIDLPFRPDSTGTYVLTVTRCRYQKPYRVERPVLSPSTYLHAKAQTLVDDGSGSTVGNGDGRVNPGETVSLALTLENRGTVAATGVSVTLSPVSSGVTLLDASSTYPTIPAGGMMLPLDNELLQIATSTGDLAELHLNALVQSDQGSWNDDVILYVGKPVLEQYYQTVRDTSGTGNGNGILEPAEETTVRIWLRNDGAGAGRGLVGKLRKVDQGTTLIDTVATYGDLLPGQVAVGDGLSFSMLDTSGTGKRLKIVVEDAYQAVVYIGIIDVKKPGVPQSPFAAGGPANILLNWNKVFAADLRGYNVWRSATSGGVYTRVNHFPTSRTAMYDDAGLPPASRYYYKVSAQDSSGNESALSNFILGNTTLEATHNFPIEMAATTFASPALCHLEPSDPHLQIAAGGEEVYVVNGDGSEVVDGDSDDRTLGIFSSTGNPQYWASPACADVDGDGDQEVVGVSWDPQCQLRVWNPDASVLPGWPKSVNVLANADPNPWGSPAVGDVDPLYPGLEIIVVSAGIIYGFHADGTEMVNGDANPATIGPLKYTGTIYTYGSPALADIDGNGSLEILYGARDGKLYVLNKDGTTYSATFPWVSGGYITSSVAVADLDKDGLPEMIFGSGNNRVNAINKNGTQAVGWPKSALMNQDLQASPAVADLDGDTYPDVVIASGNGTVYAWHGQNGALFPGWPLFVKDVFLNPIPVMGSASIGDIDGDPALEIVLGAEDSYLYGWNLDTTPANGFPIKTGNSIRGSALLWDTDNDGFTNVVLQSYDELLYSWNTPAPFDTTKLPWPMWRHDPRHTGVYGAPYLVPVAVGEPPSGAPRVPLLLQNYPNPVRSSTRIAYDVPDAGGPVRVLVRVFDVSGRHVRTLVDRDQAPGRYSVPWDLEDGSGKRVVSGVYFYRAEIGREILARKMILAE